MPAQLPGISKLDRIRQFWQAAVEPPAALTDPAVRQRSRLLNSLTLIFIPMAIVILIISWVVTPGLDFAQSTTVKAVAMGVGAVLLIYTVNRTRHYRLAFYLVVFVGYIVIVVNAIASDPPHVEIIYLIMLPLVSTLIFTPLETLVVCAVNILVMIGFTAVMGDIPSDIFKDLLQFLFLASAFILFATRQRNRLEADRQHLALEREKVQILAGFIRNVSHEFRTSLSVITVGLYLVAKIADPGAREQRIKALQEQVLYQAELLEAMLTLTRLDSRTEPKTAALDLNALLRGVADSNEAEAQRKGLCLKLDLQPGTLMVQGSEDELLQMVTQLVKNALHFSAQGDSVTVRTRSLTALAEIEVQDTGTGMDETDLPHIFERFYRVDKARSTRGAGLGLAIVKKIVDDHHGTIEVESAPGQGSTFRVRLPTNGTTSI